MRHTTCRGPPLEARNHLGPLIVLPVAWTVADLVGHDCPSEEDVAVALNFKDRRVA